jgi:hypothetical protein
MVPPVASSIGSNSLFDSILHGARDYWRSATQLFRSSLARIGDNHLVFVSAVGALLSIRLFSLYSNSAIRCRIRDFSFRNAVERLRVTIPALPPGFTFHVTRGRAR